MKLTCGIVGLPNVGKSTIFSALTRAPAEAANYPFCTIEPNHGVVSIGAFLAFLRPNLLECKNAENSPVYTLYFFFYYFRLSGFFSFLCCGKTLPFFGSGAGAFYRGCNCGGKNLFYGGKFSYK